MLKGFFKVLFVLRESVLQLLRGKGMSASVVAIVAAALVQLSIMVGVTRVLDRALVSAKDRFELTVFLSGSAVAEDRGRVEGLLKNDARVASVVLLTKEEALSEFRKDPDIQRMLEALGENPLTDSLTVVLKPEVSEKLDDMVGRLEADPGVEEVHYGRGEWEAVSRLIRAVRLIGSGLAGLVFLASLFIISNALALMLASRRQELSLLLRLGAPSWAQGGPFLLEGLMHGILGAGLSVLFLAGARQILRRFTLASGTLNGAVHLPSADWFSLYLLLGLLGAVLGFLGAWMALRTSWTKAAR